MRNPRRRLSIGALLLLGAAGAAWAVGTGLPNLIPRSQRQAVSDLGYSYYMMKWVSPGSAEDGDATPDYDTLRVGRDLNGDGSVDTLLAGAPSTSADFVPIAKTEIQWFGSAPDTLWVKFLDNSESATVYGSTRFISPSNNKLIYLNARAYRVAVFGGRTNPAGAWLVTIYCER